ncbi:CDP-diacylglycerol--serine O-phosphatidyltransferase [Candidatus Woesearchaeota archaeon]|nr:CDP-diacylglycerol--serine O-phosphatidyltransferase [Candidatus Woesearchaeota archaeon]
MKIIKLKEMVNLPNILTIANASSGLISIYFAINSMLAYAAICILIAACFDYLDGTAARMLKISNPSGKELDSLADLISFGIAPAMIGYMMNSSLAACVIYMLYVLSGLIRLARFNVMGIKDYFIGTPIPLGAVVIALLTLIPQFPVYLMLYIFMIFSITMLLPIKIKKMRL